MVFWFTTWRFTREIKFELKLLTTTLVEFNSQGWYFITDNIEDDFLNPDKSRERRYSGKLEATGIIGFLPANAEIGY